MKFFIDSADIQDIKAALEMGLCDGVTTNPSLLAKVGKKLDQVIPEICALVDGPVSAECVTLTGHEMIEEGKKLASIHRNIVVKIPMGVEGLKAVRGLSEQGIRTNVTLVFSANQALLCAKAGATYVSPFVGRLDDISQDGMALIEDCIVIFDNYGFETEVLVASVRSPEHVRNAALIGAHVATIPLSVMKQLAEHPLTSIGIDKFLADAKKVA